MGERETHRLECAPQQHGRGGEREGSHILRGVRIRRHRHGGPRYAGRRRGEKGRSVTLYHGTNSALLADILEHGLRPSRETAAKNWDGTEFRHNVNAVYLATDRERAEYYAKHSAAEQHARGRLDASTGEWTAPS